MNSIKQKFQQNPFEAYCYSYPHKTAYRPFTPIPLSQVWQNENRNALFLYIHVPFCAANCDYCNLMSITGAGHERIKAFLAALERQAEAVRCALGDFSIARMAVGGGTPSLLGPEQLHGLLQLPKNILGVDLPLVRPGIELSPATTTAERVAVLAENSVHRVSIGIQSFIETELQSLGRNQSLSQIKQGLTLLREADFPVFNIDLIYGIPGQSVESFLDSLRQALRYSPTELYLYPLYVRKLTSLSQRGAVATGNRLEMYRNGRQLLLAEGFEQVSLRHFRRPESTTGTCEYSCQSDGMIGLGCGSRSYTEQLHYSGHYAVEQDKINTIIDRYCSQNIDDFSLVDYGMRLNRDERKRRFIIKSLLHREGLNCIRYKTAFGSTPLYDFPDLDRLNSEGLVSASDTHIWLTEQGIELSDRIGPWLYSANVARLMEQYQWG